MDAKEPEKADKQKIPAQLRGETMAFALQSGLFSLGANAFEPYVNLRVQRHYASKYPVSHKSGTYIQNLAGELVGDFAGAGTLIAAEVFIPTQLHAVTRGMRSFVDPLYKSVAHMVFADELGTPGYDQKVQQWATFHERNLARSLIILSSGATANLATQKLLMKNPAPTKVIFAGKVISASITTALGLVIRFVIPNQMKQLDSWLANKYFVPRMDNGEDMTHVGKLQPSDTSPAPSR